MKPKYQVTNDKPSARKTTKARDWTEGNLCFTLSQRRDGQWLCEVYNTVEEAGSLEDSPKAAIAECRRLMRDNDA